MGWSRVRHKHPCSECGGPIPKGDMAWQVAAYSCCHFCLTTEIQAAHPVIVGTRGPSADWTWRPSRSQAAQGWDTEKVARPDGTIFEWMDLLDIGPVN